MNGVFLAIGFLTTLIIFIVVVIYFTLKKPVVLCVQANIF